MAATVLAAGEKVHIMMRRAFKDDLRRHFVGEVTVATSGVFRAEGYLFIYDNITNEYARRPNQRIQIFSLYDSSVMVTVLPFEADTSQVRYKMSEERHLVVTDDKSFEIDINEFGAKF